MTIRAEHLGLAMVESTTAANWVEVPEDIRERLVPALDDFLLWLDRSIDVVQVEVISRQETA